MLVVGDGLTGIETATEIAESRPGLSVALAARGELGARISAGATCVRPATGWASPSWSTPASKPSERRGCCAPTAPPWRPTQPCGRPGSRSTIDDDLTVLGDLQPGTMRSVSHPNVYAAGDSSYAIGDTGGKIAKTKLVYRGAGLHLPPSAGGEGPRGKAPRA
ncbi:hypothetical protein [Nonomuraea turcica]|uniref:hypothetical protein n=1 Tax=Nonomuraea sp. G32 TaxID=3067274 RepID=UPI00273C2196|nr:hypothetical protein [Nonomuraea sp. G32]MDP4503171.1 hypothetical protein [Nonomuraea sp. G32]